jgi:arginase
MTAFFSRKAFPMCAAAIAADESPSLAAIAVACGAGALDRGCGAGPAEFRRSWDADERSKRLKLVWRSAPDDPNVEGCTPIERVARTSGWLAASTRELTENGRRFFVIGGDHSCAIGTWTGTSQGLWGPLGLIWIDAHMDMHVPETTRSGAVHGMALAALLGFGAPQLTALSRGRNVIASRNTCVVGARSFEPEEPLFAERHGVRVIPMGEVRRRGLKDVFAEARAIATIGVAGYGVSLDLDAFDPAEAPGVGTPVPGGMRASEFLDIWADLTGNRSCLGVEIVEYNPYRDRDRRTARLMTELVLAAARQESLPWAA